MTSPSITPHPYHLFQLMLAGCAHPLPELGDSASEGIGAVSASTSGASETDGITSSAAMGSGITATVDSTTTDVDTNDGAPPPVTFDLGIIPDAASGGWNVVGSVQLPYIWIANSSQSTVSKINTETLVEEGRYYTRPDQAGNPSRTSVSLTGNVAVANRAGGLTKIYANPEDCIDSNGNGFINTSSGPADIKAWGQEECMAWYTPMNYASQRPVAWTAGELEGCRIVNEKVWTSGANGPIEVLLVDGDTGVIEATIPIPGVNANYFGRAWMQS